MNGTDKVEKKYDTLYNDVRKFYLHSTTGRLNASSVTTLVRYAMEVVQTGRMWKNMRGSDKKDLVLGVVTALVNDLLEDPQVSNHIDDQTRTFIMTALTMAPMVIDAAAGFAKTYASTKKGGQRGFFCC